MDTLTSDALVRHVKSRAGEYFEELGSASVRVRLASLQTRDFKTLYRLALNAGGRNRYVLIKAVLDKALLVPDAAARERDGPSLRQTITPDMRPQLEYSALVAIRSYFSRLRDPRFDSIRPLDLLPEHRALVMEDVQQPTLWSLFKQTNRIWQPFVSERIYGLLERSGAWLRAFHAMPRLEDAAIHRRCRAELNESIERLASYLGTVEGDREFFERVAATTVTDANRALPEVLPCAVAHGDFQLTNILVGPNERVTTIDTFRHHRAPIFEDMAFFLAEMRLSQRQIYSQGLAFSSAFLARCEQAFLKGYFAGEPIPSPLIRIFKVQALLDKWAFRVTQLRRQWTQGRHAVVGLKRPLSRRMLRKRLQRLLLDPENE